MLINLSNHPKDTWQKLQLETAKEIYGEVIDLPFPSVSASASVEELIELSKVYSSKVVELLANDKKKGAVHIMGEFTFTYNFVLQMNKVGVETIVSTSERIVDFNEKGIKQSVFRFVAFRNFQTM